MRELPTRYNPKEVESKWFDFWKSKGYFYAEVKEDKEPYSIVIPPPNVTGILHMGHALNNTIQDILIRYKRMSGFNAEWTPGTDHAGIATQNVVEKELLKDKKTRYDLGRERFIEQVWAWTKTNGGVIIEQLKRLGCSCDWQRERFTLDKEYSKAVNEAFIRLYNEKLIYRGSYIINWCPRCQTALSDEEAPHREIQGNLYYIRYPLKKSTVHSPQSTEKSSKFIDYRLSNMDYIVVATTRPETMFGDTALCVNPEDKRYKHLVGRMAILPIVGRELKIIEDAKVDPEFGTGVVKITPFHDANDFEIGNRHRLKGVLCINPDGTMNINATKKFSGLDRFKARELLVKELKERKLLEKIEPHRHSVGHCYRCHTMIEPYFSEQWFVRMKPLSQEALIVAKKGKIKFYPKRWLKIYINWMENIRDWCISRQIWWGHRIPAWYCESCRKRYLKKRRTGEFRLPLKISDKEAGVIHIGLDKPKECPNCGSKDIVQDADVLDTWFSSWLWPFAVYGWPPEAQSAKRKAQSKKELEYFYPTSTLITASEIIFFWVARMIMAGLYFMKEIPFHDVYIHGTVRDDRGRKMSKSLGNAIDPLEIIKDYGADALRFSLISLPGEHLYLSRSKFEFGRNFINKLWNASRFILMNINEDKIREISSKELKEILADDSYLAESWIISKLNRLILDVDKEFKTYRFNEIVNRLYDFFWHKFCDWYIEIAKINIEDEITQNTLFIVLKTILKLLHPFIPFITEEIWQRLPQRKTSIMISDWPQTDKGFIKPRREELFEYILGITTSVRNKRAQFKIASAIKLEVILINTKDKRLKKVIEAYRNQIKRLVKVKEINIIDSIKDKPLKSTVDVVKDVEIYIPLKGLIDFDRERERINKEIGEASSEVERLTNRLKNRKFLKEAPERVIQKAKLRKEELELHIKTLKKNLEELQ